MLNTPLLIEKMSKWKSRGLCLEAAVVCDCLDTLGFVTFYEERINLGLMRVCVHELPLFLSMALPVLFIVFEGFVSSGLLRLFVRNK